VISAREKEADMKRLLALLAPVLTVVALVAAPAAAQAKTARWYAGGQLIPEGETVPVTIGGVDSIYIESFGLRVTCHQRGTGTVANASGEGTESVTSATLRFCAAEAGGETLHTRLCPPGTRTELTAENLPWTGKTNEQDNASYEGVTLVASCSGQNSAQLTGTITGLVKAHGVQFGDELDNLLSPIARFTGDWHLEGPEHRRQVTAIV
jgi:hypothetical protein